MNFADDFTPLQCASVPYLPLWLDPTRDEAPFCIVDAIDYPFAASWLWIADPSKKPGRVPKWYASRTSSIGRREDGTRRTYRIWLHKEILLRSVGPPPSRAATIGDHLNGNSLDNRRCNLRWSTASENRRNIFGSMTRQLRLGFKEVSARHLK